MEGFLRFESMDFGTVHAKDVIYCQMFRNNESNSSFFKRKSANNLYDTMLEKKLYIIQIKNSQRITESSPIKEVITLCLMKQSIQLALTIHDLK